MIKYYGKHECKQFIRGKPIRFRFKAWCLNEANGYLVNLELYLGARANTSEEDALDVAKVATPLIRMIQELPQEMMQMPFRFYFDNLFTRMKPAFDVSVKSVRLVAGRLGFYSRSGHTNDFKNSIRSFRARQLVQAEVRRVLCMCCLSCMSLNSVQSFVIENCNGPLLENGLNIAFLHRLSRTFPFTLLE